MAQSRSERNPRAARCARFAARIAVRGAVVAGFAGAAWLLSAAAAHASSDAAQFNGSSAAFQPGGSLLAPVTSLVTGGGGTGLGLLDLGAGGNRHGAPARHIGSTDEVAAGGSQQSKGDLLTGTVLNVLQPVTSTVTATATGIHSTPSTPFKAGSWSTVTHPATLNVPGTTNSRTKRPAKAGINNAHTTRTQEPAVQAEPVSVGSMGDVAAATGTSGAGVDPSHVTASRAVDRLVAGNATHEKPVTDRTVAQGTHHVPLLPRPAPDPAPPAAGLAPGVPSTGSGVTHVGGAATLPATPAGTKALNHRLDAAQDAELRLLAAQKPTVSPD